MDNIENIVASLKIKVLPILKYGYNATDVAIFLVTAIHGYQTFF